MKLKSCVFSIILFFSLMTFEDAQAQKYENYTGFTVPETPVLPPLELHPSLYFNGDGIELLKSRILDPDYQVAWTEIQEDAVRFLEGTASQKDENDRPRMARTLAFYWLMTGSSSALQNSIDALMLAYDGVPQNENSRYDEIYRATWLQNYCAAYDWVFHELTAEQDSTIRTKIADETQWLYENLTEELDLAPRPHNHRSKPAWAIATAALTLSEHPNAGDWLEYALIQMNTVTKYMFSADGIYREGGHYWMFSAVNFIPFLWHYLNVSGVDLFPYYQPAFEWPVKVRMGRGWLPNHEDGYLKPAPTHMVAKAYLNTNTDLHSSASLGSIFQWHFLNTDVFEEDYTGATNDVTWEIDELILYDNMLTATAPNVSPTVKLDGGQVVFRNNWEGGDGHRYLLFHGVPEADNHNHPDHLSFIAAANDAYLLVDAGYGPDGFSDDKRNSWYTRANAHNIVTANFFAPRDVMPDSTPPTPYFFDSPFFDFAEKQVSSFGPVSPQHRRAIAFIGENYWVVTDNLTSGSTSTQYRQYLHGRGNFTLNDNQATWQTTRDLYGPAAKLDAFLFPDTAAFGEDIGYISLFKDERAYGYVYSDQTGDEVAFMQIFVPDHPDKPAPKVSNLSTSDYIAAEATFTDTTDFFFLQRTNEAQAAGDINTDANFAWTREMASVLMYVAFREMTELDVNGAILITSDKPNTMAVDLSASDKIEMFTSITDDESTIEFSWPDLAPVISQVTVNNNQADFEQSADGKVTIKITPRLTTSVVEHITQPILERFAIMANYPNPFNAGTRIEYEIHLPATYTLTIYNLKGQEVVNLAQSFHQPDTYEAYWNGLDADGFNAPSGVYFAVLKNDRNNMVRAQKMMLVK